MDKVTIECFNEANQTIEKYFAHFVICTLPMAVLKDQHKEMFYPALDHSKVGVQNLITIFQSCFGTGEGKG